MIVPSIDLTGGRAVQLVGGRDQVIDAGDPRPIAERFARVGEIAVVDLDAALGRGDNTAVIRELVRRHRCRVGGGIRSVRAAWSWLEAGAERIVLGTAAIPEVLEQLPAERVIAALDAEDGEVVDQGWRRRTGARVEDRIVELRGLVDEILVTFVEHEGRLGGLPIDRVRTLAELARPARLTVAGGVRDAADVAAADAAGADAQVGMALYTGRLDLAEAFCAPLRSDRPDGLWPTVVTDERGLALGLCYSSLESVRAAIEEGRGVYRSRSREGLWRKGETSGDVQTLLGIEADCDRDALRFRVRQAGSGFCHLPPWTCFGPDRGLAALERTIRERRGGAPAGSYTARLLTEDGLLAAKLREEVEELIEAADDDDVRWEAADLFYFAMVRLAAAGVSLAEVERVLDGRSGSVRRRLEQGGPAQGPPEQTGEATG